MLEALTQPIIHLISQASYVGIFFLMAIGSAMIPIPSEVLLPFSGFLVSKGQFMFPLVVISAAIGDLVGSFIGYYIGYFLEETVIVSLINNYGKFLLLTEHDYRTAERWFQKYGSKIVFFGKMVPGLRYFISLPAGAFNMNRRKFALFTFTGSLIWCSLLTYIGFYLGKRWNTIGIYVQKFEYLIIIFLVLLILLYLNHKLKFFKIKD